MAARKMAVAKKTAAAPAARKKAPGGAPQLDPQAQYTLYWRGAGRSQMTGAIITSGWHYYGPRVARIVTVPVKPDADGKIVFKARA